MNRPLVWVFNTYLATIAATAGVLTTLFVVPQTAAILSKAGFSDYAYDPSGTVLRTLAFVVITLVYLLLFAVVVPPDRDHDAESPFRGTRLAKAQIWALEHSEYLSVAALRALGKLSAIGKRLIGGLLVALGVSLSFVFDPSHRAAQWGEADLASAWPTLVVTGMGAWVFLVPERVMRNPEVFSWGWRVPARLLLMFGALALIGQLLWTLPLSTGGRWSTLPYTVWGVGFLVFVAATIGRLIDAAATRTAWPVRAFAAAGCVALLAGDSADEIAGPQAVATQADADRLAWYDAMNEKITSMPGEGPVVLVAASGGGSRAAVFASLTYQALDAAHLSADPASPTLGSRLLLISSVSGGSLASAYYQRAITMEGKLPSRDAWQNVEVESFGNALRFESTQLVQEAKNRFGKSVTYAPLIANFEAVHEQLGAWPTTPLAEAPWLAESAFVDDMGADFMASVLRAVIEPTLSRGNAITRLWTSQFGLGELNNAPATGRPGPLVLYNATAVESGARYVIGLPRLPTGLFGDAVGAMDDKDGERSVTGAEAARLSANFPFGFDVVRLPGIDGASAVELLDGGIVDNTGIDTLARLFERLSLVAGEGESLPPDVIPEESAKAQALLAALRVRGVLLVEIDAGARPSEGGGAGALFPGFSGPLRALDAAGSNNAFAARDTNVDRIRRVLDSDAAEFIHLAWICNRIDNVPTAWSLGTSDQAITTIQFLAEQHRLAPLLPRLGDAFANPQPGLQETIDLDALEAREFHVAVASGAEVSEARLAAGTAAVRATSRHAEEKTTLVPPPPLTPERAARAAEGAERAAVEARRVADEAGKAATELNGFVEDSGHRVIGGASGVAKDAEKRVGETVEAGIDKGADAVAKDAVDDAAGALFGEPAVKGKEREKDKKKGKK